ncbi:hypothetical protein ACLMJK_002406 [Lecanora helva]
MSNEEPFQLVTTSSHHKIFDDYEELYSSHGLDQDTTLQKALRSQYPGLALTVTTADNVSLLQFAAAGHATAELDIVDESIQRYRYFYTGNPRRGIPDQMVEARTFAKYNYKWGNEYFIVYLVQSGFTRMEYILKEPGEGESVISRNSTTDKLISTVGTWQKPNGKFVYVFDYYWNVSRSLYAEVQKASWKDVILNEKMKDTITDLMHKFFDSEDIYKDLGVPWKRGVIFYGPPGNGKTISIKALMHSLFEKYGNEVPSLYVKSAPQTYHIRNIFQFARYYAPCLLIFEDIDTIVTPDTRSYFFNEVDGLENNDGIFMVGSTNHLDQLDPGLVSRPSRFDRKYLFPLPSTEERTLYCEYWRDKLASKPSIKFPKKLCPAIAGITQEFSFAYLKEAFVATLLVIAGNRSEDGTRFGDEEGGNLDDYELWRVIKKQVDVLRKDMDSRNAQMTADVRLGRNLLHRKLDHDVLSAPVGGTPVIPTKQNQQDLPFRRHVDAEGDERKRENPRLGKQTVCGDPRRVPLINDEGMFMDSSIDGLPGLELL